MRAPWHFQLHGPQKSKRKYSNRAHLFFTKGLFSFRATPEQLERSAKLVRFKSSGGRAKFRFNFLQKLDPFHSKYPMKIRFRRRKQPRLAVLRLDGVLDESGEDPIPRRVVTALEEAKDIHARALLVRINSPGGTVGATQEIYDAISHFREEAKVPVVASMGEVAASGGVYVAMAAERVLANAGTITGSIGVIIQSRNLSQLLNKVGVEMEVVKSGQFKDTLTFFRGITAEERNMLQELINDSYEQFVEAVAKGRKLEPEKVRAFADGRVMTGRQALQHGLIDELGSFERAVEVVKGMANLTEEPQLVEIGRTRKPWYERLTRRFLGQLEWNTTMARLRGIPLYLMPR